MTSISVRSLIRPSFEHIAVKLWLPLLCSLALVVGSGCTDCKAVDVRDQVSILFPVGAVSAPVEICVDHKCYKGDGTDTAPGSPFLNGNQLSIKLMGKLPSDRVLIEVNTGSLQASINARPFEKEYRGKGCGTNRFVVLRYDDGTKTLIPT
jgi:hypothetical protein